MNSLPDSRHHCHLTLSPRQAYIYAVNELCTDRGVHTYIYALGLLYQLRAIANERYLLGGDHYWEFT